MSTLHTTWINYPEVGPNEEVNDQPSLTIPDQTLTLQELLERHTRGEEVPGFQGVYDDNEEDIIYPPLALDLTEYMDMAEANQRRIDELRSQLINTVPVDKLAQKQDDKPSDKKNTVQEPGQDDSTNVT